MTTHAAGRSPLAPAAGTTLPPGARLVVVGGGMTAHRFAARMQSQDLDGDWTLTVIGEEDEKPYDHVHLSDWFGHRRAAMLHLDTGVWEDPRITLVTGDAAMAIDRAARTVTCASGTVHEYDRLVLATGSWPWAPRADGGDLPGTFSYRTVHDVERLAAWVAARQAALGREVRGVVVGGGVLGLEAAAALQGLGAHASVVEFADRLMAVQLDDGGGEMLRLLIQDKGIAVRTGVGASAFRPGPDGALGTAVLTDGSELPADVVIFSTGIRPRDRLGREAGLAVGERGGIVVGESCQTSDPDIWAIGECASFEGVCPGLIAPGNDMADVVADRFLGGMRTHHRAEDGTKLKGVGVDAAAFGDVNATTPGALEVSFVDPVHRQYRKLVLSDDATTLLGGVFVGDIALYSQLRPLAGRALGADPSAVIAPEGGGDALAGAELPDDATVCSCTNVTAGTLRRAVHEDGCHTVGALKECTAAGTVCGSCVPAMTTLLNQELAKAGIEVSRALCEHFDHTRAELFALVEEGGQDTFTEVVAAHGTGGGREAHAGDVGAVVRLGDRDRDHRLAARDAGQKTLLLLVGAAAQQRPREDLGARDQRSTDAERATRQLLGGDDHGEQIGGATARGAAVLLGDGHAERAELGDAGDDLLGHVGVGAMDVFGDGDDAVVGEAAEGLGDQLQVFVEVPRGVDLGERGDRVGRAVRGDELTGRVECAVPDAPELLAPVDARREVVHGVGDVRAREPRLGLALGAVVEHHTAGGYGRGGVGDVVGEHLVVVDRADPVDA